MENDNKSRIIAVTVTVLTHVLAGLVLWLSYFDTSASVDESGVLVMVGVDNAGDGQEMQSSPETDLQAPDQSAPQEAPTPVPNTPAPTPSPVTDSEPTLTQDDADAPSIADQQEELRRQKEEEQRLAAEAEARRKAEEEARRKAEQEAKRRAINSLVAGALNNNGSGGQQGLQGSPDGNSDTGATQGSPGYGDYDLGGRGLIGSLPRPEFDSNITGKIVVYISVDASGTVKSATIGQGTTVSDLGLRNAAKAAAQKARFQPIQGTSVTPGRITYYFDSNN
ncbi:MAG: TonB family protein [Bacteroidales bacterium]|nr:TonB family protein [Candidatus Liminaster caballi]